MRGLELVEMEGIYMGYILLIGLWMSRGGLLLCESNSGMWSLADGVGDISISMEATIDFPSPDSKVQTSCVIEMVLPGTCDTIGRSRCHSMHPHIYVLQTDKPPLRSFNLRILLHLLASLS